MEKTTGRIARERLRQELSEAQEKKVCINCGKSVKKMLESYDDRINYEVTGLCRECMK